MKNNIEEKVGESTAETKEGSHSIQRVNSVYPKLKYLMIFNIILIILLAIVLSLTIYNQAQISAISKKLDNINSNITSGSICGATGGTATGPTVSRDEVMPKGVPAIYGKELGVAYDNVSSATPTLSNQVIAKLSSYDKSITLSGDDLQRYIKIGSQISCEFCCGAKTIVAGNGQPACGCAHSYAMRGLAKYLIKNHPTEFTDDQILEELGKWKVLFFPDIHIQKAQVLKQKGIELNYINLASNKYRGAEKGARGGSMVGGC